LKQRHLAIPDRNDTAITGLDNRSGVPLLARDDQLVTERNLARTFDGGAYVNARKAVEQYRRAIAYATRTNCKSGATASGVFNW